MLFGTRTIIQIAIKDKNRVINQRHYVTKGANAVSSKVVSL